MEDLQSEMEAGARQITMLAADLRNQLLAARHLEQADIAGKLTRRVVALQTSIQQQLETLAELRREIRQRSALRTPVPRHIITHHPQGRSSKQS